MSGIPAGAGSLLGKRLGKYEILALLALGGTAEIYLARIGGAAGFEKYVVVKSIHDHLADDPEFVKMFLDEARLAAHLDHSNIVQTMELGEQDNRYYMVMEFLAGLSLAMVVRRAGERLPGGRIPAPLVLNMMAQACGGLHYAHERAINGKALNIVHRDISPQNLVVSFEGVVKVVDFGIAKAEQRQTATRAGTIKGKFAYMSPEQCVATNVDRRTDVFALGVIAHELLTGRRLFKRNSPYETYQAVIECAVDPPSKVNHELDPAIDDVIMRAVAKDKDARYPTAEAFGDALMRYLHHRGKGSGPGDIGRFFDESFGQEIEEHGARMRELISGRDLAVDTGVHWGTAEEEAAEAKRNQTVDLTRRQAEEQSMSLHTSDLRADDLGDDDPAGDDSDMPAERTRIETNPLDRLAEMEAMAKPQPRPQPEAPRAPTLPAVPMVAARPAPQKMPPSGPLPLPAPPTGPAFGGLPGPPLAPPLGAPLGPPVRPSAARFPNLSNLPTQIAMDDVPMETVLEPAPDPVREAVRARVGAKTAPEMARTAVATDLVDPDHGAPVGHPGGSNPNLPMDYPVMNPEFSQQMLSGNVFPSAPPGSRPMNHADRETQQRAAESGPRASQTHPPINQQHAANLMSPVGQQYPQQVDWAQAAAAPARALPTWMMIALFVAAIGVALVLTIVVAKIIR